VVPVQSLRNVLLSLLTALQSVLPQSGARQLSRLCDNSLAVYYISIIQSLFLSLFRKPCFVVSNLVPSGFRLAMGLQGLLFISISLYHYLDVVRLYVG